MTRYKYTRLDIYVWLTGRNCACQELIDMLLEREKVAKAPTKQGKKVKEIEKIKWGDSGNFTILYAKINELVDSHNRLLKNL